MERFTQRFKDGEAYIPMEALADLQAIADKLADYEDLDEQCIAENQCGIGELLMKWKAFFDDIAELYDYRAIGTVSEFRELKEKATAKKPIPLDKYREYNKCPNCGGWAEALIAFCFGLLVMRCIWNMCEYEADGKEQP